MGLERPKHLMINGMKRVLMPGTPNDHREMLQAKYVVMVSFHERQLHFLPTLVCLIFVFKE